VKFTKFDIDITRSQFAELKIELTFMENLEVSIHRAGLALCIDVTYRTAQG